MSFDLVFIKTSILIILAAKKWKLLCSNMVFMKTIKSCIVLARDRKSLTYNIVFFKRTISSILAAGDQKCLRSDGVFMKTKKSSIISARERKTLSFNMVFIKMPTLIMNISSQGQEVHDL